MIVAPCFAAPLYISWTLAIFLEGEEINMIAPLCVPGVDYSSSSYRRIMLPTKALMISSFSHWCVLSGWRSICKSEWTHKGGMLLVKALPVKIPIYMYLENTGHLKSIIPPLYCKYLCAKNKIECNTTSTETYTVSILYLMRLTVVSIVVISHISSCLFLSNILC